MNCLIENMKIYENAMLTEQQERVVKKSFRERWIEPIKHPVTVPFEPWVKTKTITVTVPMTKILQTPWGLFMHPVVAERLKKELSQNEWRTR